MKKDINSGEGLEGNGKALGAEDQDQGLEGGGGWWAPRRKEALELARLVKNLLPMFLLKREDRKYKQVLRGCKGSEC